MAKTISRQPREGDAYWVLGGLYEVKASSEETAGASTVVQMTVPVGGGPPPHTHPGSESVYVLEGSGRFRVGDETFDAEPGSYFYFPAGTVETFEPATTMKLLVTYEPGGIDRFFAEFGEPAASRELPPPSDVPPDLERLVQLAERYGMQMRL